MRIPAGSADLLRIAASADQISNTADGNVIAVVFSVGAVEAFLDELSVAFDSSSNRGEQIVLMQRILRIAEEERVQPRAKIRLLFESLGRSVDFGGPPYQEYALLKRLRDQICHAKSDFMTIDADRMAFSPTAVLAELHNRGLLSHDPTKQCRRLVRALDGSSLRPWAIATAEAVMDNLIGVLPDDWFKAGVEWAFRGRHSEDS